MDAVPASQQRAVNVEKIGVQGVPGKTRLDYDARFVGRGSCQHVLSGIVSLGGRGSEPR